MSLLLAAVITLSAVVAWAEKEEVFDNPTLGFQMVKPATWHYVTAEQNAENLKSVEIDDEAIRAAVQKYAQIPLVVISKFKEPYDDLNPSIKVGTKPLGSLKGKRPEEVIAAILPGLQRVFPDSTIVEQPKEVEVAGIKTGYARLHYTLKIPDGRTFPTSSEVWAIPRGDYFFFIGAGTRQDEKSGSREEIQGIIKSIKIKQ